MTRSPGDYYWNSTFGTYTTPYNQQSLTNEQLINDVQLLKQKIVKLENSNKDLEKLVLVLYDLLRKTHPELQMKDVQHVRHTRYSKRIPINK